MKRVDSVTDNSIQGPLLFVGSRTDTAASKKVYSRYCEKTPETPSNPFFDGLISWSKPFRGGESGCGETQNVSITQLAAMKRGLCTRFRLGRATRPDLLGQLIRPPPHWPRIILPSHFRRSVTSPIDPQKRRSRRLQVRDSSSIPTRHFLSRCIGRSFSACIVFPFFLGAVAPSTRTTAPSSAGLWTRLTLASSITSHHHDP